MLKRIPTGTPVNRAHPQAQGLVMYFPLFDGGSTAYDLMNNYPMVLNNGAKFGGSKRGGGLNFDGTDDYANLGTTIQQYMDYNKPFTVSLFFTFTTLNPVFTCFWGEVSARGTAFNDIELRINGSTNVIEFYFAHSPSTNVTDGYIYNTTALGVVAGTPYHVAVTYDGVNTSSSGKIYFNGFNRTNTTTNHGAITTTMWESGQLLTRDMWIGRRNYLTGDQPFNGLINEFRVYNRQLNQFEIQELCYHPEKIFHQSRSLKPIM